MAHSWNGRLYSVKRFQSAYARRTMILPFSSNRSRTSLISNCLYCASFTPRAMFSKSMNNANFLSPFMDLYYMVAPAPARIALGSLEVPTHEAARSFRGVPGPARADAHLEMARPHLRAHASLRSPALELPLLRARRARDELDVG